MSNLLEQASLVMIPSGYKEDVVYSEIPINGAGDLSFTRASDGTRINSQGLVETVPWNLVEQSETFENAVWLTYGTGTITANTTTAPNGTTTADKFTPNTTNTQHACEQNMGTTSGSITMSIYAKADGYNWLCFNSYVGGFKYTWFNISNGTIGTIASGVSASIENVGNGWYRCIVSLTGGANTYFSLVPANANNVTSFAGDGTSGIFIWGAQLNIGATAKPYFPTTDRLNVPRLTYQNGGGGCPSLLLEKQSTNLSGQSEDFNGWANKVNITTTANYATSPDGTQNASRLQFTANGFMYGNTGFGQTSGTVYTLSCWAKRNGSGSQSVGFFVNGSGGVDSAWSLSNEYQRFTYTYTAGNSSTVGIGGASGADVSVWGWQFEASSYPTSYIPTTSSSATRVADACFKTGISSLIGQTGGTWFADIVRTTLQASDTFWLNISDNSSNNWIFMGSDATGGRFYLRASSTTVVDQYPSLSLGRHKLAIAYQSGSIVGYIDGTQVFSSSATYTFGSLTGINLGYSGASLGTAVNTPAQVNQVALFPTRLTNAELASLTTI